jgi:uncharacterized membrane protein required for colicin V production
MMLDLFFGFLLVLFGLLGFKDGIVRKLVSTIVMMVAVFVGQAYMREAGNYLVEKMDFEKSTAPMYGFLLLFFVILIAQSLLYRMGAGNYKIGGIADRLVGAAIGLGQGMLFLSSLLFILAMGGIPSRETTRDSRLYRSAVNLTPEIIDFVTTLAPDAREKLNSLSAPGIDSKEADELKKAGASIKDSIVTLTVEKQKQLMERAQKGLSK